MRPLRLALPVVMALALLAPHPANARLAGETAALTQSATPALACVTEAPTTGCLTEARFGAGNGTIDIATLGNDTYVLRGFPNTAFQANGLYRLRREASGYVVAQCFSLDATPGCTQTPLISNATKIAVSAKRLYLATSFPNNAGNGTVGGITVLPRDAVTGALSAPTACRSSVATTAQGCVIGDPLGSAATGLDVTPDGTGLYATTSGANGAPPTTVLAYDLAADGDLDTAPTCLASTATTGCSTNATVAQDAAIASAGDVDVSDDGKNVYLTTERGITALARTSATNDVVFASCLSNLASADAACEAFPAGLRFVVEIAHAGASRYVAVTPEQSGPSGDFPGSVLLLNRNATTGVLTLDSCRTTTATAGCTPATDLSEPTGVAISADGTRVHVAATAGFAQGRVVTLAVSGTALNTLSGTDGCLQAGAATATCAGGARGLDNALSPTIAITGEDKEVTVGTLDGVAFLARSIAVTPPPVVVKGVAQPRPASSLRPDKKRIVKVKVTCTGKTTCVGKLTLASTGKVRAKPGAKAKKFTFATASYSVPAGTSVVIKLKLSKGAVATLKRLRKVKSTVTARSTAGVVRTAKTTLVRPK